MNNGRWEVASLNDDQRADLVHIVDEGYVNVWLSSGDGSFTVKRFNPPAGYATAAGHWLVGDISGDGSTDLVHVPGGGVVHPWLSRRDGTFEITSFQPWPGYDSSGGKWAIGDFTEDGKADIVHFIEAGYAHVWVARAPGSFFVGTFKPWDDYDMKDGQWLVGQFTQDPKADIAQLTSREYVYPWVSNLPKGYQTN